MKYFDTTAVNKMIFAVGGLRTAPSHVEQLNVKKPVAYLSPQSGRAPATGYQIFLAGYAEHVMKLEKKHAQFAALNNRINSLRSLPRAPDNALSKKGSIDTWKITQGSHTIYYKINSGQILIFNIIPNKSTSNARAKLENPALYKVTKMTDGGWELNKTTSITTEYAALNGMLNDLNKAKWLMGYHLEKEFGKNSFQEFSLFHNPTRGPGSDLWESFRDKISSTTDVTKQFEKVLSKTQAEGNKTKWVVHSQGGIIFSQAVNYHLKNRDGSYKDNASLDKHSVSFHSGGNNNFITKRYLKRAGIDLISIKSNKYDIVNTIGGLNTLNPIRWIGSIAKAHNVVAGSEHTSSHTLSPTAKESKALKAKVKGAPTAQLQFIPMNTK